ncbi:MAG: porin [Thiohalobacterales bacterium]
MKHFIIALASASALLLAGLDARADAPVDTPTMEQMWQIIQEQQAEIEALKKQQQTTEQKAAEADEKAEAAVVAVEESTTATGHGTLLSERTSIGGYGEMHYNNLDSEEEIDFHRFVLFFGHEFTDNIRFFSELELEHAVSGDSKNGAVELEQAYIEFDLNENHRAKGGLFLIPAGILNDIHEPPTFYGVERNPIEKNIIPTTWWAGGAAVNGEVFPGWSYDIAIHEGLKTSAADSYKIRKGRQNTSEADASDLAGTGRIKWTGIPGVEVAGTVQYQSDITQGESNGGHAWLYEAHADIQRGPFGLRALYAMWDLDGDGPDAIGADEQKGFYVEPSWRFNDKIGIFARYNQWDNAAGNGSDSEEKQYNAGVNFWPHPGVVLKADVQQQDNEGKKNDNGFNLGIGYQY